MKSKSFFYSYHQMECINFTEKKKIYIQNEKSTLNHSFFLIPFFPEEFVPVLSDDNYT
jgi:hypothetical protein